MPNIQVKSSCINILARFGINWPDMLNCSRFPSAGELCMEPGANSDKNVG
jgi:hypothetical protein